MQDESKQTGNQIEKRTDLPLLLTTGKQQSATSIKLTWLKYAGATGYEAYWSYCDGKGNYKKYESIKAGKKCACTYKKLKKNRAYKFYIAAYQMVDGKKVYLAKSPTIHVAMSFNKQTNAKSISVNKGSVILNRAGDTFAVKAKIKLQNKKKKVLKHAAALRYYSTNKEVASVDKNGKITAKGQGSCNIYVVANNGVYKKVAVTVK